MPEYSKAERKRYESYRNIHLKKEQQELPVSGQIEALDKRDRNKWWQLGINVAAMLFFGYSFYFGITRLGDTFFYIILGVFAVNVVLIFYQKKQIRELRNYLEWKERSNES